MPLADGRRLDQVHEVKDLQPALAQRLRLGDWLAMHVRLQGDRKLMEAADELYPRRRKRAGMGTLEAIPGWAAWGFLDWLCLHDQEPRPLIIELKSEKGKLTPAQEAWICAWWRAGAEVAVVRPRDVMVEIPDALFLRLVEHRQCPEPCPHVPTVCTGWCRARQEAEAVWLRRQALPVRLHPGQEQLVRELRRRPR